MSPNLIWKGNRYGRFPRVSGDEPPYAAEGTAAHGFPRVSGDEPLSAVC